MGLVSWGSAPTPARSRSICAPHDPCRVPWFQYIARRSCTVTWVSSRPPDPPVSSTARRPPGPVRHEQRVQSRRNHKEPPQQTVSPRSDAHGASDFVERSYRR